MGSSGWKSASALFQPITGGGGLLQWFTVTSIPLAGTELAASDDVYARSQSSKSATTSTAIRAKGFGITSLDVPDDAIITGVEFNIERRKGAAGSLIDGGVYLVKGNTNDPADRTGSNWATATEWPTSDGVASYGGSSSLNGATLTPADVQSADFGLDVWITKGSGSNQAYIDHIEMNVHWATEIIGTSSTTDAADTLASAGALRVGGVVASTDAADTAAGAGGLRVAGTLAATDAADTLASAGKIALAGTLAATDAADTLASAGALRIVAALGAADAPDTAAGAGGLRLAGTLASTDAADTVAAAGALRAAGTLAATDAADTVAAAGTLAIVGTASLTDAPDTAAGAGGLRVAGTLAATDAADTLAAAGTAPRRALVAVNDNDDTVAGAGRLAVVGALARTDAADTLAAQGLHVDLSVAPSHSAPVASRSRRVVTSSRIRRAAARHQLGGAA